jgi:hypothetical protein
MSNFGPETQAMLSAIKQGQAPAPAASPTESVGTQTEAEEISIEEVDEQVSEEVAEPAADGEVVATESVANSPVEKIWVDDGTGRKQIELDYSNKDAIKKYAEMAYGMRKFQRERDKLQQWKAENEKKLTDLNEAWSAVEQAHQKDGIKGLVNLLVGEENAYDKHIAKLLEEAKFKESATPDELARYEAAQEAERIRRENEQIRKELQTERERQQQAKEQAELNSLQQKLNPAYAKWNFEGKLGDAELEEQYNTALWQLSINRLKSLPETEELTPAVINKTFQEVASKFNKAVTTQTKKKVAQTVQKKKDAAMTKVAAITNNGVRQSAVVDEFKGHLKSGNIVESMKMFLGGKVKLK